MPALAKLLRRWWSALSLLAFGRRCAAAAMVVLALGIVSGGAARLTALA